MDFYSWNLILKSTFKHFYMLKNKHYIYFVVLKNKDDSMVN